MLSTWWLLLMAGLGHYVIRPGAIEQFMVMENNLMYFGFNYAKYRLKRLP